MKKVNVAALQRRIKPWMFPIAMLLGVLFHSYISLLEWAVPYLIFTMLVITFCRVKPSEFRLSPMLGWLVLVQLVGSIVVFLALKPFNIELAQAIFICVLCPTATAAPVVTGMLGGSIPRVAAYSVVSNLAVALLAPFLFVWIGGNGAEINFYAEFFSIARRVGPLIVLPLLLAFALYLLLPRVHKAIASVQGVSFYLWSVSLIIVVGRAVAFVLAEPLEAVPLMITMAVVAALVCCVQFLVGRKIGRRYGDAVSGAQSLGQKNTVLAIWMCLTYLHPLASVGPAAYIAWQNIINSLQIYFKLKNAEQ